MSNQVSAMKSELSRIRELKRNAENTIELLRSDMEQGKVHLRVNEDADFRQKVAEALVAEAHPGYHSQGYHFADPVEGTVYFRQTQAAWNPWSESIDWRVVPVDVLVSEGNDFDPSVDWEIVNIPYREMVAAYLQEEGEEFEENGDTPEWVDRLEVVNFARDHSDKWAELIEQFEKNAQAEAVHFALGEILDEITIEPFDK